MLHEAQTHVAAPLLRCGPQRLPHAYAMVPEPTIRFCLLASVDAATALRLGGVGPHAMDMPLARCACSKAVLRSKAASTAWPAASASVARRLQEGGGLLPELWCYKSRAAADGVRDHAVKRLICLAAAHAGLFANGAMGQLGTDSTGRRGKRSRMVVDENGEFGRLVQCTGSVLTVLRGMPFHKYLELGYPCTRTLTSNLGQHGSC